jgi:uncharacterized membrane protein YccC
VSDLRASQEFLASEASGTGWLDLGQFRWRNVALGRAARVALGTVTPLVVGMATGHVEYGSFAALGALPTGFISFRGVTRTRVLLVAVTTIGMAVSAFVGAATGGSMPGMLVPAIVVWAYVAGVGAALGPTAAAVSLQWPVALLIGNAIPLSPGEAAVRAGLVVAGGLWQGALVVASWAFFRGSAERSAVAESFSILGSYATRISAGHDAPPPPDTLPGAAALGDPNPLLRTAPRQNLLDLMEEAERIRTTLTVLGGTHPGRTGLVRTEPPGIGWQAVLHASARALAEISDALSSRPGQRRSHLDRARQYLDAGSAPDGRSWSWAGEALLGQLRAAVRITSRLNAAEPGRTGRTSPPPSLRLPTHDWVITIRANLGISSEAGRHALRMATVAGIAAILAQVTRLPHGYWAPLTVLIVLQPAYGSTLYRGLQRAAGTLVGAGLGVTTVMLGHLGNGTLLAVVGVSLFGAYAVYQVNYLFYAVFLTDFVVVLLALARLSAEQTAIDRLIGTGVGAALALLAYILWPTWERGAANEKFARLFLAEGRFPDLLLRAYGRPDGSEVSRARALKIAARRERLDAEASADRLADEPERLPMTSEFGQGLVTAGHRLATAALLLEATVSDHHAALQEGYLPGLTDDGGPSLDEGGRPHEALQAELDRLAAMVRQASAQLAVALRVVGPPGALPPLRELQARIPRDIGDSGALFTATDAIVDALNMTAAILHRHLTPAGEPAQRQPDALGTRERG